MTREKAVETIYKLFNCGILDSELEEDLQDIANAIEENSFED